MKTQTKSALVPEVTQLRSAARAGNWGAVCAVARANSGHAALRARHGGYTLLHLAATAGSAEACAALCAGGAQVDAQDERGSTALHLAAGSGHTSCVAALIDAGARLLRNIAGKTALHDAAWGGHSEALALLVPAARAAGVLDAVGNDGRAAMHCASLSRDPALAETLLGAGADPDVVDERGRTPLDWARDLARAAGDDTTARTLAKGGAHSSDDLVRLGQEARRA